MGVTNCISMLMGVFLWVSLIFLPFFFLFPMIRVVTGGRGGERWRRLGCGCDGWLLWDFCCLDVGFEFQRYKERFRDNPPIKVLY